MSFAAVIGHDAAAAVDPLPADANVWNDDGKCDVIVAEAR